jgi:hypothetical protein
MRWTRQRRARKGSQGGSSRERSAGARTDGAASRFRRNSPDGTRPGETFGVRWSRTAKSCGPGAPMLASSLAEVHPAQPGLRWIVNPQGDGGKQAGHRGERAVSRNPSRGESRSDPVEPVVHSCVLCAHDRGCNRHPAFPAPSVSREGEADSNLGRIAPRECGRIYSRCLKFESDVSARHCLRQTRSVCARER